MLHLLSLSVNRNFPRACKRGVLPHPQGKTPQSMGQDAQAMGQDVQAPNGAKRHQYFCASVPSALFKQCLIVKIMMKYLNLYLHLFSAPLKKHEVLQNSLLKKCKLGTIVSTFDCRKCFRKNIEKKTDVF